MKHSKFKNGGLLFELLTRQITSDALNGSSSSPSTSLVRQYFKKDTELFKEAKIFNVLQQTKIKTFSSGPPFAYRGPLKGPYISFFGSKKIDPREVDFFLGSQTRPFV